MPDPVVVPDAPPAASSAAAVTPVAESDALDSLSETDLHAWRMDGKLPSERQTPTADSSSATAVQDQPASTDAPIAAASEPAKPTPGADKRIPELLADRARATERAERAERRAAELEARTPQPIADARPAASSPAPAGLVKPNPESFTYGVADPEYLEALTDYKVAATLAQERATWQEGQEASRRRDETQRVMTAFDARTVAARAAHADFDAVAMLAPTEIPPGSAADLWVLEDEAGAEILYHLQQPAQTAERRRILALGPREQLKELVRLGDRLTAAPGAARSTSAPPPPPTLSTRATPGDDVERALAMDGDEGTGAYIAAENRRDMLRLKR